jgi:hypothetical protein
MMSSSATGAGWDMRSTRRLKRSSTTTTEHSPSNSALQSARLAGRTIVAPDHVERYQQLPVLISSYRFEQEIAAFVRAEGWSNVIVTLYEQGGEEPVGVPAL